MDLTTLPEIGRGVYTFPEASKLLRGRDSDITTRRLHYWIATGLTPVSHRSDEGLPILSFDDLVSLELVRRFRSQSVSLQRVRKFERALREHFPSLDRPFAYELFFTDGANIWAQEHPDDGLVIELVGRHPNQHAWLPAIETFATAIRYEGQDRHAAAWELSPWVEIDPTVRFGAPIVRGTRVAVRTIAANLEAGTPAEVADWYGLAVEQVEGVRDYLALS